MLELAGRNINVNRANSKDESTIYGILIYHSNLKKEYYGAYKAKEKLA